MNASLKGNYVLMIERRREGNRTVYLNGKLFKIGI